MSPFRTVAASAFLFALAASARAGAVSPPEAGHSLVILALSDKTIPLDAFISALKADPKVDDETKADPDKLRARAKKMWERLNAGDWSLSGGLVEAGSQQVLPSSRFKMVSDEATGRRWLVADMPAGDAVLFGFSVQVFWQLRYDGGSPHFKTGANPYLFLGSFDGHANHQHVVEAVTEGELPATSHSTMVAVCGDKVQGYAPPGDADTLAAADAFLDKQIGQDVTVVPAEVTVGPFPAKKTYNIVVPTGVCMTTVPPAPAAAQAAPPPAAPASTAAEGK